MITSLYEHSDYFPDEAFDPEAVEVFDGVELANSHGHFVNRLRHDASEVVGDGREHFSVEEELQLAELIQAGLRAAEQRQKQGDNYDGSLDDSIACGVVAKRTLVTANLPYAAYFASASMGRWYDDTSEATVPGIPRPYKEYLGHLKKVGAWAPVAELANPRADIEDRTMVAIEAMWKAADLYKPNKNARFITYAAWGMQGALQRYSATEVGGWDVAPHILEQYLREMNGEGQEKTKSSSYHLVDGVYNFKLPPEQVMNGREGVPYDAVGAIAPEEADHFGEPIPIHMDDLTVDQSVNVTRRMERQDLRRELAAVLSTLSEQEAETIKARYGLEDGVLKTLDEIAKLLGTNRERTRQLESRALSKLRHTSRSDKLRDHVGADDSHSVPLTMEPHAKGTSHIKFKH